MSTARERSSPAATPTSAAEDDGPREGTEGSDGSAASGGGGKLSPEVRRQLFLLALPTFGLSLGLTLISTYVPTFIERLSGPLVTGVLIGTEGLFALFLPVLVGSWSDRKRSRFGGRFVFLIVAAPVGALALVLLPLFSTSLFAIALLMPLFYAAYFTYYPPYRALYPDVVPEAARGRSQGVQKTLREAGLGAALVGGGVLLGLWTPLPFVLAAVVLLAVTAAVYLRVEDPRDEDRGTERARGESESDGRAPRPRELYAGLRRLVVERPDIRRVLAANALWELGLAALRTFVIVFITVGLGRTLAAASGVLAVVAVGVLVGALAGGALADRVGSRRLLVWSLVVYGLAALVPALTTSWWIVGVVLAGSIAAGVVMALPYSMLMALMPETEHGTSAGAFELSRGVGILLGPVIAGLAIELLSPYFPQTDGYAVMFFVTAVAILASIPLVRRFPSEATDPA